ncbi:MAG TPA: hypothetical protein VH597_16135 [Verrucomicrobiae bacterium]|nr:hypothetical protein [Verrucomicrobiae bacterium]
MSKLKACWKLAGGKAEGRSPWSASYFFTALEGRRNVLSMVSGALSGRIILLDVFLGYRFAQPEANFQQPFRLLQVEWVRH